MKLKIFFDKHLPFKYNFNSNSNNKANLISLN